MKKARKRGILSINFIYYKFNVIEDDITLIKIELLDQIEIVVHEQHL